MASAAAVLLALVIGLGTALYQRERAEVASQRTERINDFFVGLLQAPTGVGALPTPANATVSELLQSAEEQLATQFPDNDDIRAELLIHLATSQQLLGKRESAKENLDLAQSILSSENAEPAAHLALQMAQATYALDEGEVQAGYDQFEQALDYARTNLAPQDKLWVRLYTELSRAAALQGRVPEARTFIEQALAAQRRVDSNRPTLATAILLKDVSGAMASDGATKDARPFVDESIEILEALGEPATRHLALAYIQKSYLFLYDGDTESTLHYTERAVDIAKASRYVASNNYEPHIFEIYLIDRLIDSKRLDEAEAMFATTEAALLDSSLPKGAEFWGHHPLHRVQAVLSPAQLGKGGSAFTDGKRDT